jgi:hypothetical protein
MPETGVRWKTRVTFVQELDAALAATWNGLAPALLTQALTITAFWDRWEQKSYYERGGGQKALLWYGFYPPLLRYLRQEKH